MKAPPFAYVRAGSLADAFALWSAAGPDAKLLAGGQSLLATLAFRLSEPSTLIDISRVPELTGIRAEGDGIRVGALTTHADLGASELVRRQVPLLAEAVPLIAHPAIRNRGTIGGSLAYADPAAELPACCVALDADDRRAQCHGRAAHSGRPVLHRPLCDGTGRGRADRRCRVSRAQARRALRHPRAGAALRRLRHGRRRGEGAPFRRHARRPAAGLLRRRRSAGHRHGARWRRLPASPPMPETIARAQAALDADLDPPEDQHGSPDMKRHLARVLLARAVQRLAGTQEARAA